MIKDLLVPIIRPGGETDPLSVAIAIADAYAAHIAAVLPAPMLSAAQTPWGVTSPSLVQSLLEDEERAMRQRVAALREYLDAHARSWDVRTHSNRLQTSPAAMAMQARYADLSVMRLPADDVADDEQRGLFSALLFESGRPVLVVPTNRHVAAPFRNIVLAWKDTREAARALHDTLALFSPASMDILMVDPDVDEREEDPGAGIAAHVAKHVPDVSVAIRKSGTLSITTTILLHAAERGADLVVAGGYGHSRLREWVLGGTTHELLRRLDTPVLFSH